MQSASVVAAGLATHPQSDKQRLRVTVDHKYASGGIRCATTEIWTDPHAPVPAFGDTIEWDHRHVKIAGHVWAKMEYDSPTNAPLH